MDFTDYRTLGLWRIGLQGKYGVCGCVPLIKVILAALSGSKWHGDTLCTGKGNQLVKRAETQDTDCRAILFR